MQSSMFRFFASTRFLTFVVVIALVGKTTMLREIARVLSVAGQRVIVVDTSNEIAGDGDVPHPGIGHARRMQVRTPSEQHAMMVEAVENHMPEVIVIDEPLRTLDGSGNLVHPWVGAVDPLLRAHVEAGEIDSVLVYWPGGNLPHGNYWGLTAWPPYRGAGYSWVVHLGGEIDVRSCPSRAYAFGLGSGLSHEEGGHTWREGN